MFNRIFRSRRPSPEPAPKIELEGPNSHVADYINYYKSLKAPGFAVLVKGEWGTGKTHLMKQLLPWEGEGDEKQSYYVSFFGLKSSDEVYAALYAQMFPWRSATQDRMKDVGDGLRGTSVAGFGTGGVFSGAANVISAYMRREIDKSKPLIFDDLERSSMSTAEEILGVINHYVEHERCRVIVIAHDEKIVEAIKDANEKIFGQTIAIQPDARSAFEKFRDEITDGNIADRISRFKDVIVEIFSKSEAKSLRILRHAMFDLERLVATLETRHIENEAAMRDLVQLFIALAIEVRKTTLDDASLTNRHGAARRDEMRLYASIRASFRSGTEIELPPFAKAQHLYNDIDLENQLLNDDVLIDMLVRGRYCKEAICASLDNSTFFVKIAELPPWRKISEFDKMTDEVVEEAAEAMERQFAARAVTEICEMLHIFALRLMMAKYGRLRCSVEQVADENKAYIDALLSEGRLPASTEEKFESDILRSAVHGHRFWVEDGYVDLFDSLVAHLRAQAKVALGRSYAASAEELLKTLSAVPREFANAIGPEGKFAHLPVMKEITITSFVETWLNAPNRIEAWYWTKVGLERRYSIVSPFRESLSSEAEWVAAVISDMRKHAEDECGFKKLRIERAIPTVIFP